MSKNTAIKSSLIIISLGLFSKLLAMMRETLIASKFGATYDTDIYMFAIGMVSLLFGSIGSGLVTTFIPMLSDYIEKKSYEERNRFVNNVLSITLLLTLVIGAVAIVLSYYIVYFFAPGFRDVPEVFSKAVVIMRIMVLSIIFIGMQNVMTGVLQSHKEFTIPAAMPIFLNLVYIVYLVLFASRYGIMGFTIATIVAYFAQYIIHIPGYKKLGYKFKFVFDFKEEGLRRMLFLTIPVIIGTSVAQVNFLVDRLLASKVYEGALSVLTFANKLNTLVYSIFAVAITTVVYPTLSTFSTQKNTEGYRNALTRAVNIILLIMVPATVGMMILRTPIVDILFKRGAFDDRAASLTAIAMFFYSPAMVANGIRDILNRAFYSIKDTKTPMINSALGLSINIVLNLILVKYMKIAGLALATSVASIVTTMLLFVSLNKKLNGIGLRNMFKAFIKISISSVIMGVIVYIAYTLGSGSFGTNFKGNVITIVIAIVLGIISYGASIHFLKVDEYVYMLDLIKTKLRGVK